MARINKLFVLFVALNLGLALYASRRNFATKDEMRQVAAGLSHLRTGRFQLAGDTPPLCRMVAVLPFQLVRHSEWFLGYLDKPLYINQAVSDQIATFFAYENTPGYQGLVFLARLASLAWWLLGAWLIFRWSRELYGDRAGCLGLLLWCFEPGVMAYTRSATPEIAVSVAALVATYALRYYLRRPSGLSALGVGALLGTALLTDFTALLLPLVWLALLAIYRPWGDRPTTGPRLFARCLGHALLMLASCVWIMNAGYGRSDAGPNVGELKFASRALGGAARTSDPFRDDVPRGNRFAGSWLGGLPAPVPDSYLLALDHRLHAAEALHDSPASGGVPARRGDFSWRGVVYKVPVGMLLMVLATIVLNVLDRSRSAPLSEEAFLLGPVAVIALAATFQVGFRWTGATVLSMMPFLAVATSRLANLLGARTRVVGSLVVIATAWVIAGSLSAYPHSAFYLNELAGGPRNATNQARYGMADSGQDLRLLSDWLQGHPDVRHPVILLRNLGELEVAELLQLPPRTPSYYPSQTAEDLINHPEGHEYYIMDHETAELISDRDASDRFEEIEKIGYSMSVYRLLEEPQPGRPVAPGHDAPGESRAVTGGYQYRVHTDPTGEKTRYAVFVPKEYREDRPNPAILFLHGGGDSGTEGRQYLRVGLPRVIEERGDSYGFLVVCPQGRTGEWTGDSADTRRAMGVLEAVEREYQIDPTRIYLTGLSSGGKGTWSVAAAYPDRWAAIVPISPGGGDIALAPKIKHIPCWTFQSCTDCGRYYRACDDSGSLPDGTRQMIKSLRAAGGAPRYMEVLAIGDTHDAWDTAYTMPELYQWMRSHQRLVQPHPLTTPAMGRPKMGPPNAAR